MPRIYIYFHNGQWWVVEPPEGWKPAHRHSKPPPRPTDLSFVSKPEAMKKALELTGGDPDLLVQKE